MTGPTRSRLVVISGCSGGGKSSLLSELASRGHQVIDEPGRRAVQLELAGAGLVLPWTDGQAFARRLLTIAAADLHAADPAGGWVFFDRGLVDATVALAHATGQPVPIENPALRAYHRQVFLTPPWPGIYVNDSERRHTFNAAAAEYDRLATAYADLGYTLTELPRTSIAERAQFVLATLARSAPRDVSEPS